MQGRILDAQRAAYASAGSIVRRGFRTSILHVLVCLAGAASCWSATLIAVAPVALGLLAALLGSRLFRRLPALLAHALDPATVQKAKWWYYLNLMLFPLWLYVALVAGRAAISPPPAVSTTAHAFVLVLFSAALLGVLASIAGSFDGRRTLHQALPDLAALHAAGAGPPLGGDFDFGVGETVAVRRRRDGFDLPGGGGDRNGGGGYALGYPAGTYFVAPHDARGEALGAAVVVGGDGAQATAVPCANDGFSDDAYGPNGGVSAKPVGYLSVGEDGGGGAAAVAIEIDDVATAMPPPSGEGASAATRSETPQAVDSGPSDAV